MDKDWPQNPARLKLFVWIMTGLLAVGLILLVVGMAKTAGELTASEPSAIAAAAPRAFEDGKLALPEGAEILDMTAGDGRLWLRLRRRDGGEELRALDATSGRMLGRIRLEPGP